MKIKGKNKKRWQRHCSSVSNPSEKRFREAAKNRFFKPSGPSALTVEALQKHDHDSGQGGMELDAQQSDAQTFNTWATNFTNCTNLTFSRVHKLWNSNNAVHKEILALLATLTEVIQEKGGTGTEIEYFYALISYMEEINLEDKASYETATAAALLLNMAVKKVSASALKSRFSDISKGLLNAIVRHAETESSSLLKSLLMTLACVLRVQDAPAWAILSTKNAYKILLDFVLHKKPRVRKAAHQAVKVVLKGSLFMSQPNPPPYHPAAMSTSEFCVTTIEKKGGKLGAAEAADTLHSLDLLQDVLVTFPRKNIEQCCNTILSVMTVSKPLVIEHGMKALQGLFSQHPDATSLPAQLNAQIINALHNYRPEENDSGTMPVWLSLMGQAHLNLSRLDVDLCLSHLPKIFSEAMRCLLSHHGGVRNAATTLISMLFKQCIGVEADKLVSIIKSVKTDVGQQTPLHKVVGVMETGLSYQFNRNWDLVFHLLAIMMEVLGPICPVLLKRCLSSMADLRDSVNFGFKSQVDVALGKAVRFIGPRQVMEAIPLNIAGNEENPDLSRSWLLPVIRDNVSDTELSFFITFFFPLATSYHENAVKFAKEGKQILSKTYESLELQVWSMLKGFSTRPTDLSKAFSSNFAKELGKVLTHRPDLQLDVMAGLRCLVISCKNNEKDKATMSKFAKNYLPILLNIFSAECENPRESRRLAALETVKVYLTAADDECLSAYLKNCFKNLAKEEEQPTTVFKRIALHDIATMLVNYADVSSLEKLFTLAEKSVQASDKSLQKKGYSILKEIVTCQSDASRQFMASHFDKLQQLLLTNLPTAAPSTKNPRLKCLASICEHLAEPNNDFVRAVIPEAVQCTRGVGERARASAFHLIVEIAHMMMRWNPDVKEEDVLSSYIDTMLAGLSGSAEMMSATLLSLTRLLTEYREKISGSTLSGVVQITCVLLQHDRKEVAKSCLDFIKTMVGVFKQDVIITYLSEMLCGLGSMKSKTALHVKTKFLLKKLMKKCGHEAVLKLSPQSLHKVVQKASSELKQEQKKKKEHEQDSDKEDEEVPLVKTKPETIEEILQDSDLEEEEDTKPSSGKQAKKSVERKAWIKEGEEDITDLMDVSAAKKVMASKPKTQEEKSKAAEKDKDHGFKIAPDGRLVITEPKDDRGEKMESDDEEDLDDLFTTLEGGSEKKRRKRLRDDAKHADEEPPMKYKAGGTGIHRPVKKSKADIGEEYKAKKAGGDIKMAGKHDPYAYVPLDFSNLNKRKQAKLKGQYKGLVKGARKGVLKAKKGKGKKR